MATASIEYANLRAEMARVGICIKDIAEKLEVTRGTIGDKLSRKRSISLDEVSLIKTTFFPEKSIEYLFAEAFEKK